LKHNTSVGKLHKYVVSCTITHSGADQTIGVGKSWTNTIHPQAKEETYLFNSFMKC